MSELKCCPFCGGEAFISIDRDGEVYKEWFTVYCDDCGAEIKDHRRLMCNRKNKDNQEMENIVRELVNKWNTRQPQKEEQNG